jgi:hypothetical protein
MSGSTRPIVTDLNGKPAPQYYNPTTDNYEYLQGRNGANRVELYGPDGNPIGTTSGKINVRASEAETILTAIQGYVDGLETGVGAQTDAEATGNGSAIAVLKRLRTLLAGGLPAALSAGGGIKAGVVDALPAGTNNIGDVDLASSIPVGDNTIGRVKLTDGTAVPAVDAATQRLKVDAALTGSIETTNSAPVVGVKTVTATAAEVFAGASAKANRRKLLIKNESNTLRFRVGPSSVTQQNGFPVEPGAVVEFQFDPATAVAIYAISEGTSLSAAVMEL